MLITVAVTNTLAFAFCFCLLFGFGKGSECKRIEYTQDKCRSSEIITIASQEIRKGAEDVRVKLIGLQKKDHWFCGNTKEELAWGEEANQIRVNFKNDGTIQWSIYKCDDLSGPVAAGIKCADEAYSTACPGDPKSNVTCVFEVEESTSFIDKTTTTVQVEGSVAKDVKGITGDISGSVTHERSKATVRKFGTKSYLVIPAGFKFCSYSNAASVKNVQAPTGFEWQCSGTQFVQAKLSYTGTCSSLPKCKSRLCSASRSRGAKLALNVLIIGIAYSIAGIMS